MSKGASGAPDAQSPLRVTGWLSQHPSLAKGPAWTMYCKGEDDCTGLWLMFAFKSRL